MAKSKCTCKSRNVLAHPRNRGYPHEEGCYYVEKLAEEDRARKDREDILRLYKGARYLYRDSLA